MNCESTLAGGDVHLWHIALERGEDLVTELRRFLSAAELERADRYRFDRHRRRFIVRRAAMRQIVATYVQAPPQALSLSYTGRGKPSLSPADNPDDIRFNLTDSHELALLAVARGRELGVDVEYIRDGPADEKIARRFFSSGEVSDLISLPADQRRAAFFACWTRKEAYIKALGEGLSAPLDQFRVSLLPGEPAALLESQFAPAETQRWSMQAIDVGRAYVAALAIEGLIGELHQYDWSSSPQQKHTP